MFNVDCWRENDSGWDTFNTINATWRFFYVKYEEFSYLTLLKYPTLAFRWRFLVFLATFEPYFMFFQHKNFWRFYISNFVQVKLLYHVSRAKKAFLLLWIRPKYFKQEWRLNCNFIWVFLLTEVGLRPKYFKQEWKYLNWNNLSIHWLLWLEKFNSQ